MRSRVLGKMTRIGPRKILLASKSLKFELEKTTSRSRYLIFIPIGWVGQTSHLVPQTAKIGSLVDVQDSEDPEGLRVFYYLVQDLKVSDRGLRKLLVPNPWARAVPDLLSHITSFQNQADLVVCCRRRIPVMARQAAANLTCVAEEYGLFAPAPFVLANAIVLAYIHLITWCDNLLTSMMISLSFQVVLETPGAVFHR